MAITYVGKGAKDSGNSNGETLTPALPSGLEAGDFMIIFCTGRPDTSGGLAAVTTPSGWTLGSNQWVDADGTNELLAWYYYRYYENGDGTPSIIFGAGEWYGDGGDRGEQAFVVAHRGVDQNDYTDVSDVTSSASSGTTFTPTGLTTSRDGTWVLSLVTATADGAAGVTINTSQSFTTILAGTDFRFTGGVDTNDHHSAFTHKEISSAGAVTCPTYGGENEVWGGITIALKRAPESSISPSMSPSVSPSVSLSVSPSISVSCSPSTSPSASPSTSISPSVSPSISVSCSPSTSLSISSSISISMSPSASQSLSPSLSPSISISVSPSASLSLSPSISPSISISVSPSVSISISQSVSPSVSPSPSPGIKMTPHVYINRINPRVSVSTFKHKSYL